MTVNRTEAIAGLVLLAFTAFAWSEAASVRGGAAFFPRIIIGVLGFFSLVYLLRSIVNGRTTKPIFRNLGIFAITLGASVVYILAVPAAGYATATVLFIPALSWAIGFRRPLYILAVTAGYVLCVYGLFEIAFNRPMPAELPVNLLRGML